MIEGLYLRIFVNVRETIFSKKKRKEKERKSDIMGCLGGSAVCVGEEGLGVISYRHP